MLRDSEDEVRQFLQEALLPRKGTRRISNISAQQPDTTETGRPRVTLTWAQTMNGFLSRDRQSQMALSGQISLQMTHCLRSMHEAVLVGIGTVMADNPQLNIRHVTHYGNQPRPIVLDTQFRILTSARLLENNGKRTMPWIYVHPDSLISDEARQKQKRIELQGVRIVPVAYGKKKGLCLQSVLEDLYVHGLRSVMVEGGPTVHEAFLEKNCVDDIVITVVPRWIPTGVGVSFQKDAQFNHVRALSCHDTGDIVLAGKWISK